MMRSAVIKLQTRCLVRRTNFVQAQFDKPQYAHCVVCVQRSAMAEARLLYAAFSGDCKALRSYIKKGFDCTARQRKFSQRGLLHVVGGLTCTDCDKSSIIQSLVKAGADVNALDDAGLTPLMVCAMLGHCHVAQALLKAGADVDAVGPSQRTALHVAALQDKTDIVPVLLAAGASLTALCQDRFLPLHNLCYSGTSSCEVSCMRIACIKALFSLNAAGRQSHFNFTAVTYFLNGLQLMINVLLSCRGYYS
jgi:Ankyrin repeats (3 copies)